MQSNFRKYKDTTPEITPAGKLFAQGGNADEVIRSQNVKDPVPAVVSKFTNTNAERPEVGQTKRHYGKANDADIASKLCHGVRSVSSLNAKELVSPELTTKFQDALLQKKESIYHSRKDQPLGKARDLSSCVPHGLDKLNTTFGKPTTFTGTAAECVNPNKTVEEIEEETNKFHDLYVASHLDYRVGELPNRKYDWSKFPKESTFGLPTPHTNNGEPTKRSLKWIHETKTDQGAKVVSEVLEKFRERTQPQLGKVLDPNKDTRNVADDHTFGIMLRPDEYGTGDLLHGRSPDSYLRGRDRERSVLHAIRQHLKKSNYHNFDSLSQAFQFYDRNNDNMIDANELREVCHQLNVPIEDEMLSLLMSYCVGADSQTESQESGEIGIDYVKFANFLNWKDKLTLPLEKEVGTPETPTLSKQIDKAVTQHMTSSSVVGALNGISTNNYRTYGIPTVRTDLSAPVLRRINDKKSYGNESTVYGLMNPNLYSRCGLTERDFFLPRSQDEIRRIFEAIGVKMSDETFHEVWRRAKSADPRNSGEVCVETFRMVLDEAQATQIEAA